VPAPRRILFLAGAIAAAMPAVCAEAPPSDPLLQAMRDEVNRSVKLNLPNLEAPYFVEYLLDESDSFTVSASLGACSPAAATTSACPKCRCGWAITSSTTPISRAGAAADRAMTWEISRSTTITGVAPLPLAGDRLRL
jgi:hypothetical protein